mmetsp:Transcript_31459/g.45896  ORF Transcript_31459/g.45896 Transcript_31459/m.45896 type:complete len:384 (+) Transcript_31459:95-1246(+)
MISPKHHYIFSFTFLSFVLIPLTTSSFLATIKTADALTLKQSPPVALLTGATGRTGQIVTNELLKKGFQVRIFCRDGQKAKEIFRNSDDNGIDYLKNIEFCQGDLGNENDIQAAFSNTSKKLTHVIFMAGGEDADYRVVSYQGLAKFAQKATAVECNTIRHFVVISTAWCTKPYSIASLLFNTLYFDTLPMASYYLGEQALRKAAAGVTDKNSSLNYVILRAGGLNSDERYAEKYPDAATMGLTYQQGDTFDFFGIAGRPGMSRSQLANAVLSAVDVEGQYTVEVTGSGNVDLNDSSFYQELRQDDNSKAVIANNRDDDDDTAVFDTHTQAVKQLKNTAIAASLGGIAMIGIYGWFQGLVLLLSLDAIIILLWSRFFANKQAY